MEERFEQIKSETLQKECDPSKAEKFEERVVVIASYLEKIKVERENLGLDKNKEKDEEVGLKSSDEENEGVKK